MYLSNYVKLYFNINIKSIFKQNLVVHLNQNIMHYFCHSYFCKNEINPNSCFCNCCCQN